MPTRHVEAHLVASRSNVCCTSALGDLYLVYNAFSGCLAEFALHLGPQLAWLKAPGTIVPTDCPSEIVHRLVDIGAVVPRGFDEVTALKELRASRAHDCLALTVAPTMQCNFRCHYCFEEHRNSYMSDEVEDHLRRFVLSHSRDVKGLHVTWFGGEPLLSMTRIHSFQGWVNELCEGARLHCTKTMVTNGYLLTERRVESLVGLGAWDHVQVTIDGPAEVHDARRVHVSRDGTWEVIVGNLAHALDAGLPVAVRINVDSRNFDSTILLLDQLMERGIAQRVTLGLGAISDMTTQCSHIEEHVLSRRAFARASLRLRAELMKRGLGSGQGVPRPRCESLCTADTSKGFVVAPSGLLFKCWNQVHMTANAAVGHVAGHVLPRSHENAAIWDSYDPLAKSGCRNCSVLAVCMGSCPWESLRNKLDIGSCQEMKFYPDEVIRMAHFEISTSKNGL